MRFHSRALGALVTASLTLAVPAAGATAAPRNHVTKLPADYAAWTRVANCESGGWVVRGAAYPNSLGITRTNYVAFGGEPQAVGSVARDSIVAQIRVADRLVQHYHVDIPDQGGCAAW